MKASVTLRYFFYFFLITFSSNKTFSQCFEIESILVAACIPAPGTEGYNEMVRFKVGAAPINIGTFNVNWPAQTWQGLVQNAATAANVVGINAQIALAGGCGQVREPVGGVIPANATVLLITSYNFTVSANIFGAISQDIYILFQDNASQTGGHFGNYNATPGTRTLTMSLGSCSDSVTYERSLLVDTTGTPGSAPGATVNFTPSGTASYTNPGCVAPVEVFSVEAGTTPVSACPGTTIALAGSAVGYTTVIWTASSGSFSTPSVLNTNYTLSASATGSIVLTLTATNPCGTTITDSVTVNVSASATPTFNPVAPICAGDALAPLPTTSTNGIAGAWSPAINNTGTTTYTFTPNVGQCAVSTTLIITVNAITIPAFNPITVCSGASVSPLPTTSLNGISGFWSPAFNNTTTTTYTFIPSSGSCVSSTTLTVNVNSASTVPTFSPVAPICVGDALAPLPLISVNGISGTWSPTLNNLSTTTYIFTPDTGQCATSTSLTIGVNSPVTPKFNPVPPVCSGASIAPLPLISTNGISGTWSPLLNNIATTTYTFTPNAGQCAATAAIIVTVNSASTLPIFTPIAPICEGTALSALPTTSTNGIVGTWSPALNNISTTTYNFAPNPGQCAVTTTVIITVVPMITPTFNPVTPICSGGTLLALPTIATNGIAGVWSPPLNNTSTTTYFFTPSAGQCAATTNLTITVTPAVMPIFTPIAPVCSGTALSPLPLTSMNGIMGTWSPPLNNISTTIYTFLPTAGQCANTTSLTITVIPTIIPLFATVAPVCPGTVLSPLPSSSTNGVSGVWSPALNNTVTTTYTFTPNPGQCSTTASLQIVVKPANVIPLFNAIAPICAGASLSPLPVISTNGIAGSWSPALNNATTTTYAFTPVTGQCAVNTSLVITVVPIVVPDFIATLTICNGTRAPPLNPVSPNGVSGTWSPGTIDNTVSRNYIFTPDVGQCATSVTLAVIISDNVINNEQYFICLDAAANVISPAVINTGLSPAQYSFSWSLGTDPILNTTNSYQASVPGIYTVVATNLSTGCTITIIADVIVSPESTAIASVSNDFDNVQQIIVTVTGGAGNYQYQLDNGPFQSSNIFHISQGGEYTIHVKDDSGCNNFELHLSALGYPKFFTPNGDGFNDTWNIAGLPKPEGAKIYIFDRYGKLVKEIAASGNGWNGIYNERELPATDYWFVLFYQDKNGISKEFKSHFSLKR